MAYDNAAYLKERYQTLRALGLCVNCKADSPDAPKCEACRERHNAWKRNRKKAA